MPLRTKTYTINVEPVSWARAGVRGKGSYKPQFYDTQVMEKVAFGLYMQQQHNDEPLFERPISVDATFFMPIPRSKKDRRGSIFHAHYPDLDNLLKLLLDSMKPIIVDDRIVSVIHARKIFDPNPRTVFT